MITEIAKAKKRKPQTFDASTIARYSRTTKAPFLCIDCGASYPGFPGVKMHFNRAHGHMKGDPSLLKKVPGIRPIPEPDLAATGGRNGNGTNGAEHHDEGKTKVRWTTDERKNIVDAAVAMWMDNPAPGFGFHFINEAVKAVMPPDRQRNLTGDVQCKDIRDAATAAAKEIIAKAVLPSIIPEPQVVTHTEFIERPMMDVLAAAPLDVLAGALAAGEMRLKMRQYEAVPVVVALAGTQPATAKAAPAPEKIDYEARRKEIEKTMPQVQVVGIRGPQHEELMKTFSRSPVIIHPSIDPSAPVDSDLIAAAPATIYVEAERGASDRWKANTTLACKEQPFRRLSVYGLERIMHKIKGQVEEWVAKNPKLLGEWQSLPKQK